VGEHRDGRDHSAPDHDRPVLHCPREVPEAAAGVLRDRIVVVRGLPNDGGAGGAAGAGDSPGPGHRNGGGCWEVGRGRWTCATPWKSRRSAVRITRRRHRHALDCG